MVSSRNSNQTLTATCCHPGRYGYRIIQSYEKYVNRTKYDIMILNKGGAYYDHYRNRIQTQLGKIS